ncbi:MAG: hypothetical protein HY075_09925 [Deltaproteobacteria bacterium]|nr:hypothetical protein [Deltaproteobacteria bacterium]
MMLLALAASAAALALADQSSVDYANPGQVQPYIESLKKKYDIKPRPIETDADRPAPKTAAEEAASDRQRFSDNPTEVQPHIEKLRKEHELPEAVSQKGADAASSGGVQPYIESGKMRQDLTPQYKSKVDQAAGFTVVASNKFNLKSDKVQANTFEAVYNPDGKYAPSAELFYERQLVRSRALGALGLDIRMNVITIQGHGVFTKSGATSTDTTFRFYAVPVTLGATYRFLQLRFVDPFISLGVVGIPFLESRDDDHPSRRGISRGYNVTGGIAFNLDWISRSDAWEQYDSHGILHTYVVAQLEYLRSLSGPVQFNYDGMYLGLMFEF